MKGKIRKNKVATLHFDGKEEHKIVKRQLSRGRPVNTFFFGQPRVPLGCGNFRYPKYGGCL